MREKIIRFFKMWTLPLGMCAGFAVYFLFRYIPWLAPLKALANGANDYIMPFFIFVMLFTTFCKVNPREIRIKRWHMVMILFQLDAAWRWLCRHIISPTRHTVLWCKAHWSA